MVEGESIVGAVYRCASRHVLPTTFPVLREAGISRKSINSMQLLPIDQVTALAEIIRCDPDRLGRDAGIRQGNAAPDERGRQRVRFGDLVIEGCHLDHKSRRFSSASLKASPHHRIDWLNRLLPFCPFSFEQLIDACPSCLEKLSWTKPLGIEVCEKCEHDLREFSSPHLDPSLRRDYRLFADLCSPEENRRETALVSLPPEFPIAPAGTLVRAALHIGQFLCGNDPIPETHLSRLPAGDLAQIVSSGMHALTQGPDQFQSWVANEANARRSDQIRYSALKRSVRLFARRIEREPGGGGLIKNLLPEFAQAAPGAPVALGAHYSMAEAKKRLHTDYDRIKMLCESSLVENSVFEREDGTVSRRLLDAERVDQIAADLDRVTHHWEFWKVFRLPSYAVEQLICLGVVEGLTDPAIVNLKNEAMVPRKELDHLVRRMRRRARKGTPPPSAKSLRVLSHELGGRLKPWGYIWKALLDGDLPFWTKGAGCSTQQIFVEPLAWKKFSVKSFDQKAFPDFPFKTFMNNCDLSEVLNLQPSETIAIRQAELIDPRAYRLTLRYEVEDVLGLAARYISITELMRRSGEVKMVVLRKLTEGNVKARSCLWDRATAEAATMPTSVVRH